MGTLHRLAQKAMAALPETSCGTCLKVRAAINGYVLAAETAVSKRLGLSVGDKVSPEQSTGHLLCMEFEVPSMAETQAYLASIGMSFSEFASMNPKLAAYLGQSDADMELEAA